MGLINTQKSGQYLSIQPVISPAGAIIPAVTIAPQQTLVGGENPVLFEGSPIETTAMMHATTITLPAFPGLISGTVHGIGKTMSGYSNKLMIDNHPAVTNTAKKITNTGNAQVVPMAESTSAQSYCYVNDGGGSGVKSAPSTPGALEKMQAANPPWSDAQKDDFSKKLNLS